MLELREVESFYGVSQVLFKMALKVEPGEVVTLVGRNGMGKTTTLKSIMGIVQPRAGHIFFQGEDISRHPSFKIAQRGLALVPEGRQVFPNLTAFENLHATAANRRNRANPWTLERVFAMFPLLAQRRSSMGNLLSGGEQQMLAIGRALMTNPELLILDEATEGLAPLIRHEIWACLKRLKDEGQAILVVDKNIADLCRIADRHYIIEKGAVVWRGTSKELIARPELHARYLGV
ncbi:MAG: ABC transporter ATP-binding protein [Hyphomicrobiales bacterium]|nr:ABC transporter ATP-binding protein [Hyphomicrobiales bacterium]